MREWVIYLLSGTTAFLIAGLFYSVAGSRLEKSGPLAAAAASLFLTALAWYAADRFFSYPLIVLPGIAVVLTGILYRLGYGRAGELTAVILMIVLAFSAPLLSSGQAPFGKILIAWLAGLVFFSIGIARRAMRPVEANVALVLIACGLYLLSEPLWNSSPAVSPGGQPAPSSSVSPIASLVVLAVIFILGILFNRNKSSSC